MSAHKNIDKICVSIVAVTVIIALLFCNGKAFGIEVNARTIGYENRLFDNTKVHTFDIVIDDWDSFIETCESEEYSSCNVVIDGELIKNVGIRGKGNTSLSSVRNSGSSRYSFKVEFDQYDKTKSYHGLDKLCLNNIIQDNTYMKDYLAYTLMKNFGVDAPLCSFVYITVNGEDWGLYLAVEAIEDSFLERNYGSNYGDLYKPDSMSFGGGGPGNGKNFSMTDFINENTESDDNEDDDEGSDSDSTEKQSGNDWSNFFGGGDFDMSNIPNMGDFDMSQMPNMGDFDPSSMPDMGNFNPSNIPNMGDFDMSSIPGFGGNNDSIDNDEGSSNENNTSDGDSNSGKTSPRQGGFGGFGGFGGGFGMGSDDVKLKYIDDDIDSYSNIFNNAKTTVNKTDKNRLISSLKALSEQSDIENTVDVDEVIRYFIVHNFLCNGDSYTGSMIHNYYLYEKDGQLSMIPWDYNLAYGSFTGGNASSSVNAAIDTPVSGDMSDRPMISWIFGIEEYTEIYHEYFQKFLDSVNLTQMIEDTAALIDEYVEKDPTKFCTYEDFLKGVEAIKQFCELRAESVQGQLDGTIPSTSAGQSADSSALIDVNGLSTSDMGSMGGGAGGGFGGGDRGNFGGGNLGGDRDATDLNDGTIIPELKRDDNITVDAGYVGAETINTKASGYSGVAAMATSSTDSGNEKSQGSFGDGMPGGFGGGMPGGFGGGMPSGDMPDGFDPSQFGSKDTENSGSTRPSSGKIGSSDRSSSDKSSFNPSSFSGFSGAGQSDSLTEYILLGVSFIVMLIGLLVAILFKRRK